MSNDVRRNTMTDRDQWGETGVERHERILTRDLAWLVYSESHACDGVPCTPADHLHFDGGWAAAYAAFHEPAVPGPDHG
jgi:hypothetical protein